MIFEGVRQFLSAYWQIALVYLALANVIAFAVYGADKRKAKKNKWRVPEATLILLAAIGGSIGALAAMKIFRHKTKHARFYIGVPVILALQVALAVAIFML